MNVPNATELYPLKLYYVICVLVQFTTVKNLTAVPVSEGHSDTQMCEIYLARCWHRAGAHKVDNIFSFSL